MEQEALGIVAIFWKDDEQEELRDVLPMFHV